MLMDLEISDFRKVWCPQNYMWGPPNIDLHFDLGVVEADVIIGASVKLTADFSIEGTGGARVKEYCNQEDCNYGSIGGEVSVECGPKIEAIACVRVFIWEACGSFEMTPLALACNFSGSVVYNSKDSCSIGLDGDYTLGQITLVANVSIDGAGGSWEYIIYNGMEG